MDTILSPHNTLKKAVAQEAKLFFAFTRWNITAATLPGCIFAIPALRICFQQTHSLKALLLGASSLLIWNILFIYFFDLSNQIPSIEEDRVNKPDRPLCTGQATLQGAKVRWYILLILFLGTTLVNPRVMAPTLTWICTIAFLCFTPLGKHWAFKNTIAMTTGTWALLAGSWQTVLPLTPMVYKQCIYVAAWTGIIIQIQDLRDIEGDKKINRNTLPLAFGDANSRSIITFIFIPLAFLCLLRGGITDIMPMTLLPIHLLLGYRVVKASEKGDARYDHQTYMMMIYELSYILAWISVYNLSDSIQTR